MPLPRLSLGGVLALDLSSRTGWAYGTVADRAPHSGVWVLPRSAGEDGRYSAFDDQVRDALDLWRPDHLVLEAPLSFQALLGVSTAKVMQQQYTLRGIARLWGWRFRCSIFEIDAHSIRTDVMGRGRFAAKTVKQEVVAYCRARGWDVVDHNAADACLTWTWKMDRLRYRRPAAGPLFAITT